MFMLTALCQRWRGFITRVRARLLDECRCVWRRWSVQLTVLNSALSAYALAAPGAVQQIWYQLPPEIVAHLPRGIAMVVPLALNLAVLLVTFVKQKEKTDGE